MLVPIIPNLVYGIFEEAPFPPDLRQMIEMSDLQMSVVLETKSRMEKAEKEEGRKRKLRSHKDHPSIQDRLAGEEALCPQIKNPYEPSLEELARCHLVCYSWENLLVDQYPGSNYGSWTNYRGNLVHHRGPYSLACILRLALWIQDELQIYGGLVPLVLCAPTAETESLDCLQLLLCAQPILLPRLADQLQAREKRWGNLQIPSTRWQLAGSQEWASPLTERERVQRERVLEEHAAKINAWAAGGRLRPGVEGYALAMGELLYYQVDLLRLLPAGLRDQRYLNLRGRQQGDLEPQCTLGEVVRGFTKLCQMYCDYFYPYFMSCTSTEIALEIFCQKGEVMDCNTVIPNHLFLGSSPHQASWLGQLSRTLQEDRITDVWRIMEEEEPSFPPGCQHRYNQLLADLGVERKVFPARDGTVPVHSLARLHHLLQVAHQEKRVVLLHCAMGVGRSASTLAYHFFRESAQPAGTCPVAPMTILEACGALKILRYASLPQPTFTRLVQLAQDPSLHP